MNILINASNIRKSGALQVTLSFLEEVKKLVQHNYLIVVSEEVEKQINPSSYPVNCRIAPLSTGTPDSKGFLKKIKMLTELETSFNTDCVFSVFAPTYWTPKAPHLAGFAYVWAINPDSVFIKNLPAKEQVKNMLGNAFRKYFIKKNARYHVVEEEDVKRRLSKYFGISPQYIYVVNNTYNHHFNDSSSIANAKIVMPDKKEGEFNLVTISSNFPHKNLKIIPAVSAALKAKGYNTINFYVTIKQAEFDETFTADSNIKNLGTVPASECPYIYSKSDALFLPTMLECFSASYPEAMVMKKPILTSDLSFARSICEDAAVYFDPMRPDDIADKIITLVNDAALREKLVTNGLKKLASFPSATQRAAAYIDICNQIVNKEKHQQ